MQMVELRLALIDLILRASHAGRIGVSVGSEGKYFQDEDDERFVKELDDLLVKYKVLVGSKLLPQIPFLDTETTLLRVYLGQNGLHSTPRPESGSRGLSGARTEDRKSMGGKGFVAYHRKWASQHSRDPAH